MTEEFKYLCVAFTLSVAAFLMLVGLSSIVTWAFTHG